MKLSFDYKGTKVDYQLMYKKTAAIAINVDADGNVKVTAPLGTSLETVIDKVKGNAPWIIGELMHIENQQRKNDVLDYYTYLGKNYGVEININKEAEKTTVKLARGKFIIETFEKQPKMIRDALMIWYKDKVTVKVKERLKIYGSYFEKVPKEITAEENDKILFRIQDNHLFASLTLGMMPISIIDYIIVSGLCSLNYPNDITKANEKLKGIISDYEEDKAWLEKNKSKLVL